MEELTNCVEVAASHINYGFSKITCAKFSVRRNYDDASAFGADGISQVPSTIEGTSAYAIINNSCLSYSCEIF